MKRRPWPIIILALVMCAMLYAAGVLSGLYANKITEERTQESLSELKQETQEDIDILKLGTEDQIAILTNYIEFLENNINTVQLQGEFLNTLPDEQACDLASVTLGQMTEQLQGYRDQLPYRLEQYERENELTEEYLILKRQYNSLSIRTWIFARDLAQKCSTPLVHGLYFYDVECSTCVAQGEQLDILTEGLGIDGWDVMLFTIDARAEDPMVEFLKAYYDITTLPAIVVNDEVFRGRVFTVDELLEAVA